jgi:hypothetical protein
VDKTKSPHAIRALDFLFCTPIFKSSDFIDQAKIPDATARRILTLVSGPDGLLKTLRESSGRRPAVYAFRELLNIAEGREVF